MFATSGRAAAGGIDRAARAGSPGWQSRQGWMLNSYHGDLYHDGRVSRWEGQPGEDELKERKKKQEPANDKPGAQPKSKQRRRPKKEKDPGQEGMLKRLLAEQKARVKGISKRR